MRDKVSGFGLLVIGSEILDGRVRDVHVDNARALLLSRGLRLAYVLTLPDAPPVIEAQLRWAYARDDPFFCCGGIGATPDDHTRACAAHALGLALQPHAEGLAILERRFGPSASPGRLRMVDFPEGATLIPNPVNEVPGFRAANGWFLPGFPSMALPMMSWVVDTWYEAPDPAAACTVLLPGAREGDLVPMMERLLASHDGLELSSLPRFTADGTEVELRLAGAPDLLRRAAADMKSQLAAESVAYEEVDRDAREESV